MVAVAIIFLVGIATLAVLNIHISLDALTIDLDIYLDLVPLLIDI